MGDDDIACHRYQPTQSPDDNRVGGGTAVVFAFLQNPPNEWGEEGKRVGRSTMDLFGWSGWMISWQCIVVIAFSLNLAATESSARDPAARAGPVFPGLGSGLGVGSGRKYCLL